MLIGTSDRMSLGQMKQTLFGKTYQCYEVSFITQQKLNSLERLDYHRTVYISAAQKALDFGGIATWQNI